MTDQNTVGKYMSPYPYLTNKKMSITQAFDFMQECKIRHLPVIEHGKIIGLVSERDLKFALGRLEISKLHIEDVMRKNPYVVNENAPLGDVTRYMAENRYGSALVTDSENHIKGIFTTTDALRLLSEIYREEGKIELPQKVGEFILAISEDSES